MEFTLNRNVKIISILMIVLTVTQIIYTGLYVANINGPQPLIWGLEAILFTFLAAFAGAAMVQAKDIQLGWSAIAFSAVLNVIQVSIGLKLFEPFGEAAGQVEALGPLAGAIVAFSFMIYNTAKILLGFAALIFGMFKMNNGSKTLGGLTALVGGVAIVANVLLVLFGRNGFLPPPVAGATGVLATLLLALCLTNFVNEE